MSEIENKINVQIDTKSPLQCLGVFDETYVNGILFPISIGKIREKIINSQTIFLGDNDENGYQGITRLVHIDENGLMWVIDENFVDDDVDNISLYVFNNIFKEDDENVIPILKTMKEEPLFQLYSRNKDVISMLLENKVDTDVEIDLMKDMGKLRQLPLFCYLEGNILDNVNEFKVEKGIWGSDEMEVKYMLVKDILRLMRRYGVKFLKCNSNGTTNVAGYVAYNNGYWITDMIQINMLIDKYNTVTSKAKKTEIKFYRPHNEGIRLKECYGKGKGEECLLRYKITTMGDLAELFNFYHTY